MGNRVRCLQSHEWRLYRCLRLRALNESPDAFGTLYEDAVVRGDPDWAERLSSEARSRELPLVGLVDDQPAGLLWASLDADGALVTLYQMWVAPEHRGIGLSRQLLARAIEWARARGASRVELGVTDRSAVARALYESVGFEALGEARPLPERAHLGHLRMRLDM